MSGVREAVPVASAQDAWLTTILRPAGVLDTAERGRLSAALGCLAVCSDMVIVDLTAAEIGSPRALAMSLRAPARAFEQAGTCLLLVGASAELAAALDRAAVPVITLAADVTSPAGHDGMGPAAEG